MTTRPPYPSLTLTWHNDIYPAIESSTQALNQDGKTIIITGAVRGALHNAFVANKIHRVVKFGEKVHWALRPLEQETLSSLGAPKRN
jgi:hypothetical protein